MQTTFLDAAGVTLFTRDDMEQGNWTQEEYTVNATFPFVSGKVIERGQRILFHDPATDSIEVFEIRNVNNIEPEHYQQIIAEHIVVSELSDEHINTQEITDKTPKQALDTVLAGTLWAAGNMEVSRTSSVDIGRGSVWQAVGAIAQNWNVYITPRVTVNTAGAITGRYLDVSETTGVWRGLRLSIDKNMSDSSVVYDDSETLTALYGYGGMVDTAQQGADDTQTELTFASVVWTATAEHPAKPAGQAYIEDPQATALYGRNGRPRFGYYQNSEIEDPAVLLQKTWESLQQSNKPKISITGTVSDLYRFGYKDQPIRLHDMAIVDIPETGEKFQLQIIKNDVDLIDPTATRPDIGDYIANIVYINRETNEISTGGSVGGGGGGGGRSKGSATNLYNTYADLAYNTDKYGSMIGLVVGRRNGNNYIQAGQIALSINNSGKDGSYVTVAHLNADRVWIGQNEHIDEDFQQRTLDGSLTAITTDFTTVNTLLARKIEAEDINATTVSAAIANIQTMTTGTITCAGLSTGGNLSATGAITGGGVYLSGGGSLANAIASFGTAVETSGRIMIPTTKIDGTAGPYINFNIAATQYYQDGVAAARPSGIVEHTQSATVTVVNSNGDTIGGPYSVRDTFDYGYTSGVDVAYPLGVAEGESHFSLASVTLQGSGEYITAINASSGIKISVQAKYNAGTPYTLYEAGTPFSYNDVGNTAVYTRSHMVKLTYVGQISGQSGFFYKVDTNGTAYYQTSSYTPTAVSGTMIGTEVTGTNQGTPVAVFVPDTNGTAYYLAGDTKYMYAQGQTVTDTYYTKIA